MKKIHILLCTYNLTPQKKSRRCFCSEVFSEGIEAKLNQGDIRIVKTISLGIPTACFYINKNLSLQFFKLLFFEHYTSFVKLGESSLLLFCFWSCISIFCRPPSVVSLLEYSLSLKERREGKEILVKEKILGNKKVISTSMKV
jgi:hypothetical protein